MTDLELGTPSLPTQGKCPPTDADRIRLFMSLMTQHEGLVRALPASPTVTMRVPDTDEERDDHQRRQLRAASVRKFIVQKSDQVYLGKVFDSVAACVSGTRPEMNTYINGFRQRLAEVAEESLGEYVLDDDAAVLEPEIIEDVLYGRVLHGDYEKWWRTERRTITGWEVTTLANWLFGAERMVGDTRDLIAAGLRGGHLRLD